MNEIKKIVKVNSIIFFIGWVIILFLGADKPVPPGFYGLIVLIVLLDIAQAIYLKTFINIMKQSKLKAFIFNVIFFLCGAMLVTMLTLAISAIRGIYLNGPEMLIWTGVLSLVSSVYGVIFYCFNIELYKYITKRGK